MSLPWTTLPQVSGLHMEKYGVDGIVGELGVEVHVGMPMTCAPWMEL